MRLADKEHCCGCAGCSTICPFGAIKMEYDEEFFLHPVVDMDLCKNCGKCEKACPIINKTKIDSHNIKVVQGFFKDDEKHKASASGGAATAFAEAVIQNGGCVFGSAYTDDYKDAVYVKIDKLEDLHIIKSSKYIETRKGNVFQQVLEELKTGRQVLFTGLPCDIGGVKSYVGKDFGNLYTCELICHGPTSRKVQEDYIDDLSRKYKSKVVKFSSRYKVEGIEAPYIKVDFENGESFKRPLWDTEYGYAFATYNRPSCYNCSFKGDDRVADISIGDSWCAGERFGNEMGVSIMYAHTGKGLELLKYVEDIDSFVIEELDYEKVKNDNPAIRESVEKKPERSRFFKELRKVGLKKAALRSKNLKDKLKFIIKSVCKKG